MPLLNKPAQNRSVQKKGKKLSFRERLRRNKNKDKLFAGSVSAGRTAIIAHKKRLKELTDKMGQ